MTSMRLKSEGMKGLGFGKHSPCSASASCQLLNHASGIALHVK